MKITKEQLNKLPQLDRIQYLQKGAIVEQGSLYGFLFFSLGLIVALFGNYFSFVFYIVGIFLWVNGIRNSNKLNEEYFKVVKK